MVGLPYRGAHGERQRTFSSKHWGGGVAPIIRSSLGGSKGFFEGKERHVKDGKGGCQKRGKC